MNEIKRLETNVDQAMHDLSSVKEAIVASGVDVPNGTRTSEYAGKVTDVYNAGYDGYWGYFWDEYQNYGKRTAYDYAFGGYPNWGGGCWRNSIFKPKHNMQPTSAYGMFYRSQNLTIDFRDLEVELDFSKCTDMRYCFYGCALKGIGVVSCVSTSSTNSYSLQNLFGYSTELVTVEKLILRDDGANTFVQAFDYCLKLRDIEVIEGVIGNNLKMSESDYLTKKTITNVFNALSGTTSGKTLTLKTNAINSAFGSTDSDEWKNLIATKSNWTITLV